VKIRHCGNEEKFEKNWKLANSGGDPKLIFPDGIPNPVRSRHALERHKMTPYPCLSWKKSFPFQKIKTYSNYDI
jgi:hypothetical protein